MCSPDRDRKLLQTVYMYFVREIIILNHGFMIRVEAAFARLQSQLRSHASHSHLEELAFCGTLARLVDALGMPTESQMQ